MIRSFLTLSACLGLAGCAVFEALFEGLSRADAAPRLLLQEGDDRVYVAGVTDGATVFKLRELRYTDAESRRIGADVAILVRLSPDESVAAVLATEAFGGDDFGFEHQLTLFDAADATVLFTASDNTLASHVDHAPGAQPRCPIDGALTAARAEQALIEADAAREGFDPPAPPVGVRVVDLPSNIIRTAAWTAADVVTARLSVEVVAVEDSGAIYAVEGDDPFAHGAFRANLVVDIGLRRDALGRWVPISCAAPAPLPELPAAPARIVEPGPQGGGDGILRFDGVPVTVAPSPAGRTPIVKAAHGAFR